MNKIRDCTTPLSDKSSLLLASKQFCPLALQTVNSTLLSFDFFPQTASSLLNSLPTDSRSPRKNLLRLPQQVKRNIYK